MAGTTRGAAILGGKTVVITGASSGAGRAMALAFSKEGCNVALGARRMKALNELVIECESLGGRAIAMELDVTDSSSVKALQIAALGFSGTIDVWINNAGVLAVGETDKMPSEIHEKVVKTNLLGYIYGAHAVLPEFKRQGFGILINNISVGGYFPTPYAIAYTASKFGLRGYSDALKAELVNWKNIHVCDLYTAFLDTPGVQHSANYTGHVLRPAPPIFDPVSVAKKVVELVKNPSREKVIDPFTVMLKTSYGVFPKLTRAITTKLMDKYFNVAAATSTTGGNVLESVEYGTSIHGGWNTPGGTRAKIKAGAVGISLFAGLLVLGRLFK